MVMKSLLEHKLITDSDSCDMVCSVSLKGSLNGITLPFIRRVIVRDRVVAKEHLHVYFGLLYRFQLIMRISMKKIRYVCDLPREPSGCSHPHTGAVVSLIGT